MSFPTFIPGEIEVIASDLIRPGKVYLVQKPVRFELGPLRLLDTEPPSFELPASIRYGFEFRIPKLPMVIPLNVWEDRTCRQMWRDLMAMSERWMARRQRRLDYRSNVRRRKRWAELARRKGRG